MLSIKATLAGFVLFSLPVGVSAAVYDFKATETSALSPSAVMFSFALDTLKAFIGADGTTTFGDVGIVKNDVLVPANAVFAQYGTTLGSPLFYFVDTGVTPFSAGAGTAIAFDVGKFAIADGATDGEGTLNVSTVPEPSLWALLIAGAGIVGLRLRRYRRLGGHRGQLA